MNDVMTNIGKTKSEIIYELVLSLNKGNCGYYCRDGKASPRIDLAESQYRYMVDKGVIIEI